jgi:hypothetical protein
MKRTVIAAVSVVASMMLVSDANAAKPTCAAQIAAGYRKNVMWPWPDVCPDRASVRAPFDIMVQNGWRRQNLLGPHHFSAETGELNMAGELKVHWVMTQAPPAYRQIYVERSLEPNVTESRIAAARAYAMKVAVEGEVPYIQDTHLIAEGRPAAVVDFINVSAMENMPAPVLPAVQLGQGASN